MSFLLDTCVISELRKPKPDKGVLKWFKACDEKMLYICAVTLGELRYGIDLLPSGKKKATLLTWYEQVCQSYSGHIIEVTSTAFEQWGASRARLQKNGQSLAMADGLIAAAAVLNGMTLVTRNTDDFKGLNISILNPWE